MTKRELHNIEVLFENNDLLVINKPAGLRTHGDGRSEKISVVDWILEHYPGIRGVGEPMEIDEKIIDRPGIVHRLDEETSGVLIIAKTQETFVYLKEQFKERRIEKEYRAFVWGHFKESTGTVDVPIGRSKGDFRRWQAGRGVRGEVREALTRWEVLSQFTTPEGDFSFMKLSPKTGRTHQLRVHMKYLQRPIVSDNLYGGKEALGFERVALHARQISFIGPHDEEISVCAPYPNDFEDTLGKLSLL